LDFPEPLGPTMAVMPPPNSSVVGSAKVLKPKVFMLLSFISLALSSFRDERFQSLTRRL
jgi:hypothetical protein